MCNANQETTRVDVCLFDGQQFEKFSRIDGVTGDRLFSYTVNGIEVGLSEWTHQREAAIARDLKQFLDRK